MNRRDLLKRGIRLAAAAPVVGLLGQNVAFAAPPAPKPRVLVVHTPMKRTLPELLEHFSDKPNGAISPDDTRDFIVSVFRVVRESPA